MEYKGYVGKIAYDESVGHFHGQVIDTWDTITFAGDSVAELQQALRDSVEDYLAFSSFGFLGNIKVKLTMVGVMGRLMGSNSPLR